MRFKLQSLVVLAYMQPWDMGHLHTPVSMNAGLDGDVGRQSASGKRAKGRYLDNLTFPISLRLEVYHPP